MRWTSRCGSAPPRPAPSAHQPGADPGRAAQCCGGDAAVTLVSAGKDGAIIFWRIVKTAEEGAEPLLTPEIVGQLMPPRREQGGDDLFFTSIRYHPSMKAKEGRGGVVALDTHGKVTFWPGAHECREPVELQGAGEAVFTAINISPAGDTIAAATSSGEVVVWSASGLGVEKQWQAHAGSVFSLTFGPATSQPSLITACTATGELKAWDATWSCRQTVALKADTYDRVATTAGGEIIFLASSKSASLLACHVGKSGLLDHATKCNIGQPVLSFTAETDAESVGVFGVQTSAIQQFTLATDNCRPPPGLVPEPAPAPAPTSPIKADTAASGGTPGLLSPRMVAGGASATRTSPPPAAAAGTAPGVDSKEVMAAIGKLEGSIESTQQLVNDGIAGVSARVDAGFQQLIAAQAKQQSKLLSGLQAERERQNAALKKQILDGLPAALTPVVKNAVKEQVQQLIVPAVQKAAAESADGVATSVAASMQSPMQDTFRAGIVRTRLILCGSPSNYHTALLQVDSVLPALETAIQKAFVTVNSTLEQGLTTCLREPVESSLQQLQESMQQVAPAEPSTQPSTEEPPAPDPDPKAVIDSLLQSENYEQAFVEALSARSVPLIIWMLEKLDPSSALASLTQVRSLPTLLHAAARVMPRRARCRWCSSRSFSNLAMTWPPRSTSSSHFCTKRRCI